MSITRTYRCNLCRDQKELEALVGLHWESHPAGYREALPRETENHICTGCMATLQAFKPRCGQGFECDGGPNCGSDHK